MQTTTAAAAAMMFPSGVHAQGSDVIRVGRHRHRRPRHRRDRRHAAIGGRRRDHGARRSESGSARAVAHAARRGRRRRIRRSPRSTRPASRSPAIASTPGFDAYKKVLASDVDLVILATPPGFRPMHLAAAVDAGKHVFTEKPVATDSVGVRSVLATYEAAQKKNLAIVAGTQRRHQAELPRDDQAASTTARSATIAQRPGLLEPGRPLEPRAAAELVRHRVADPQLALLHLALRRPHRRAARPQHRRRQLGAAAPPGPRGRRRRPAAAYRSASTATSTITSRSTSSTRTACT